MCAACRGGAPRGGGLGRLGPLRQDAAPASSQGSWASGREGWATSAPSSSPWATEAPVDSSPDSLAWATEAPATSAAGSSAWAREAPGTPAQDGFGG